MSCICNFCCCFRGCWAKLSQQFSGKKKYKTVTSDPRDQLVSNNSDENIKIIGRKTTLAEEDKSLDSEAIALDQFEQGSNVNEKIQYTSEVVTIDFEKSNGKIASTQPIRLESRKSSTIKKDIERDDICTDRSFISSSTSKDNEMEILDSKSQQVEINNNSDNDKAPECPDAEQEEHKNFGTKSADYTDSQMDLFHNSDEKAVKVRDSAASDLIDFPVHQDSNKESFAHESIDSNDRTIKFIESPQKVDEQFDEIVEEQLLKIVDYEEIQGKILNLNQFISKLRNLENELSVFETQLDSSQSTQNFISAITNKINNLMENSEDVLNELTQIEEIAQESPKPYSKEEIEEANDRIKYIYQQVDGFGNSVAECELEFKAFERSESKAIIEYIKVELDNYLPKYEEINERIASLQADIERFQKMFTLMKSKNDYKDNIEFIQETMDNLKLELQRIEIFQKDSDSISEIVKKGVQWQINRFKNIDFEELREMRRYFGNLEPMVFNKILIEEEYISVLDINDRILNVYNDLGDANIQNNFSNKAMLIEELNEILNCCEGNARALDDTVNKIRSNHDVIEDDLIIIQEIEDKLDNYFEQISELNKRCEDDNQKVESLRDDIDDLPNVDIISIHTNLPSDSTNDSPVSDRPTLIDEIDALGRNTLEDLELSNKVNAELESHLTVVEEIESKYNK